MNMSDPADLDRVIESLEQEVEQSPPNSPSLPGPLNNLGGALMHRYRRTEDVADLERAIGAFEQAVDLSPPNSPSLPVHAMGTFEQAERYPRSSPILPAILNNLGYSLERRYRRTEDVADLERAIEASEQAVELSPPGSPTLPDFLHLLGGMLGQRYHRTGDLVDLERAIEAVERAIELSPPDSRRLPVILNNLGTELERRYDLTGDVTNLERAIGACLQAVDLSPPDSAGLPSFLNNLSEGLGIRYELKGDVADLERAIGASLQAVDLSPPDSPRLPTSLNILQLRLLQRYGLTEDVADLERAIEACLQTVDLSPPDSAGLPSFLSNLGGALMQRYELTGDVKDLDKAIDTLERAWSSRETTFPASSVAYKIGQQSLSAAVAAQLVSAHLKQAQVNPSAASVARRRAFEAAEGSKSRLLTELIGRADLPAPPGISSQLVDHEGQLLANLTALDTVELTSFGHTVTSQAEAGHFTRLQQRQEYLQELHDLWTQIAEASPEAADYVTLRRGTPLLWDDFARLATDLGAETALVSFFTVEGRALLFIVRAGWEEPAVVESDFGESAQTDVMDRLFRDIHTSGGSARRGETWHGPLKKLLEKATPHLDGVRRIVFAPYTLGHLIPWSVVAERAGWLDPDQKILPLVTLR